MPYSNFPNGITSFGIPTAGMGPVLPTGNVFFVSSVDGSDGNAGVAPSVTQPLATVAFALSLCTANNGDFIYCMPGHAETISAAAGIALDVAGVTIIGLGSGDNRPTITFSTDTAATMTVTAANIRLSNFRFIGNIAALATMISVSAAGFELYNSDFYVATATTDVDITILTTAAANDMVVSGCNFNYETSLATTTVTNASTEVIRLVGADRAEITGNYMSGTFSTSAINGITTASKDVKINNNYVYNKQTANVAAIVDLVAACTGTIAFNNGFSAYVTDIATIIDPSSCAMVQNYFSNVVTETGGLVGTPST